MRVRQGLRCFSLFSKQRVGGFFSSINLFTQTDEYNILTQKNVVDGLVGNEQLLRNAIESFPYYAQANPKNLKLLTRITLDHLYEHKHDLYDKLLQKCTNPFLILPEDSSNKLLSFDILGQKDEYDNFAPNEYVRGIVLLTNYSNEVLPRQLKKEMECDTKRTPICQKLQ